MSERATLTIAEAAQALGCSRGLAYKLAARGELPVLRLGRKLVVPRKRFEELLVGEVIAISERVAPMARIHWRT